MIDTKKWLSDHSVIINCLSNGESYQTLTIDDYTIEIYQTNEKILEEIMLIDKDWMIKTSYTLKKPFEYTDVVMNLLQKLSRLKPDSIIDNLIFQRRLQCLKEIVENAKASDKQMKYKTTDVCRNRIVIDYTKTSILACLFDILPQIINGLPFLVVTDVYSTIPITILRQIFIECGGNEDLFLHAVDFRKRYNRVKIVAYILTETSDIHSALDNIFDANIVSNVSCIKVFAQQSLRLNIEKIIEQKIKNQFKNDSSLLFNDNELFTIKSMAKLNLDATTISNNEYGIQFYYYRYPNESIKMINQMKRSTFNVCSLSIWSNETDLAYRMSKDIETIENISINHSSYIKRIRSISNWKWKEEFIEATNLTILNKTTKSLIKFNEKFLIDILDEIKENDNQLKNIIDLLQLQYHNQQQSDYEYEECKKFMQIKQKRPLGHIIIVVNDNDNNNHQQFMLFCLHLLMFGNSIILIGKKTKSLEKWEPIIDRFESNDKTKGIMTIFYQNNDEKILEYKELMEDGLLLLIDKQQQQFQSLCISEKYLFNNNYDWQWTIQWIRQQYPTRTITIAIQHYNINDDNIV